MKRSVIIPVVLISMILCGCQNTASEKEGTEIQNKTASETATSGDQDERASESVDGIIVSETGKTKDVAQDGPYGALSLSIPEGWKADAYPIDSDDLYSGMYGIRFYPEGVAEGVVELVYMDSFGVCGTGLETKETTIAGVPARIGIYDNHEYWDFISFQEEYEGIVALTYSVADWWGEYGDQVMDILETVSFDQSVKEGAVCIFDRESELDEIGLQFSLKNISRTGATLVFNQFDTQASTGDLVYSDDFVIEIQNDGKWEAAPVVLEGEYGSHGIAYIIEAGKTAESDLSWEWLYGELAPGEYRIGKSILDCRESGDFDKYMIYAHFILN